MRQSVLTGFGFGPVQAGLFVKEAYESRSFRRIVVAEIDQHLVDAVHANGGRCSLNVAHATGIDQMTVDGVELVNPTSDAGRERLLQALGESTEIVTALPSVDAYTVGGDSSVASLIAGGLQEKGAAATIVYAAENNNRAAEILAEVVTNRLPDRCEGASGSVRPVQFLNTVIGKMSRVVVNPDEIAGIGLAPIAPGISKAFLVESFNHIFVTRTRMAGFMPGISAFEEKDDLLPFEEAKLYGHNAVHSVLAYLGAAKGYRTMPEVKQDADIMRIGRAAFLDESGAALIRKHGGTGERLFTPEGFREYADDLLERMTRPFLADTVERAARDPLRKLGRDDRIFGTMALALEYGIEPQNMALGAAAALQFLLRHADTYGVPLGLRAADPDGRGIGQLLRWIWRGETEGHPERLIRCVRRALPRLAAVR